MQVHGADYPALALDGPEQLNLTAADMVAIGLRLLRKLRGKFGGRRVGGEQLTVRAVDRRLQDVRARLHLLEVFARDFVQAQVGAIFQRTIEPAGQVRAADTDVSAAGLMQAAFIAFALHSDAIAGVRPVGTESCLLAVHASRGFAAVGTLGIFVIGIFAVDAVVAAVGHLVAVPRLSF